MSVGNERTRSEFYNKFVYKMAPSDCSIQYWYRESGNCISSYLMFLPRFHWNSLSAIWWHCTRNDEFFYYTLWVKKVIYVRQCKRRAHQSQYVDRSQGLWTLVSCFCFQQRLAARKDRSQCTQTRSQNNLYSSASSLFYQ